MANTKPKPEAEVTPEVTPAVAPDVTELLAQAEAAEAQLRDLAKVASEKMAAAKAAVDDIAKPYRERITAFLAERKELIDAHQLAVKAVEDSISAVLDEAEAAGIPKVLIGMTTRSSRVPSGKTGGSGQRVKLSDIGITGPVRVTAPHRTGEGTIEVDYSVFMEGDEYVASGQRVGSDTVKKGSLSIAASQAGWHNGHDVMYALLAHTGKLGEFPNVHPQSDASTILVDGAPVTVPEATD